MNALLYMPPYFSGSDLTDKRLADAEQRSHLRLAQVSLGINAADFLDSIIGQLRHVVSRAALYVFGVKLAPASVPSLGRAIAHVRGVVAQEKMNRPEARAIVAMVADEQPVRDFSMNQLPGLAMNSLRRFIAVHAAGVKASVSIFVSNSIPCKTWVRGPIKGGVVTKSQYHIFQVIDTVDFVALVHNVHFSTLASKP